MAYTYKIGQSVMVNGRYGHVFHQEIINGVENYSVYLYGDEPVDSEITTADFPRSRVNINDIVPHTADSIAGGNYKPFSGGARARHRDGTTVKISDTSTVVNGKRIYTGWKEGHGWDDFPEDHLV